MRGSGKLIGNTMNVLRAFSAKAAMRDINRDFCLAFIDFLRNTYVSPNGKKLSQFTCVSYFGCFRGALNAAVREEIIPDHRRGQNPHRHPLQTGGCQGRISVLLLLRLANQRCSRLEMEECGLRCRTVAHQYHHAENPPTAVSSPFHECKEMDAGTGRSRR